MSGDAQSGLIVDVADDKRGLSLATAMEPGISGLFGPSGAGKSTFLDLLAGLRRCASGSIVFDGQVWLDSARHVALPARKRPVGYAFQDDLIFRHRSVRSNLAYGRRLRTARAGFGFDEVVERLGLSALLDRCADRLSGGEAKRVGIGRALLAHARLLLLDEPLSGLDEGLRSAVLDLVRDAARLHGLTVLYVSHSLWEIQELTERIVFLDAGRLLGAGAIYDVLADPRAFAVASKLGIDNLLEVEVLESDPVAQTVRARLGEQFLMLPETDCVPGARARVSIRPADVLVARHAPAEISARNLLRGHVTQCLVVGDRWLVAVDVGGGQLLRAELTGASVAGLDLCEGREVCLVLKTYSFSWRP